jgi:hypothetical protein
MRASWTVRILRAAVFAAVCVTLSAAAHRVAVGATPPLWAGGCGFLAVLAVACPLSGRERSLRAIAGAMLAVQVALHFAFDAALPRSGAMGMRMQGMPGAPGGHEMAAHGVMTHSAVAHLLAALLASWWLHRGEAAFWSLLRRARSLAPGLAAWWGVRTGPGVPVSVYRVAAAGPAPVRGTELRHAVSRRGPPAMA